MTISIQPVTTIEEGRLIEQLQQKIWASTPLEVAPDHLLLTMAHESGIVLLARSEAGEAVGFAYGFLARTTEGRLKLASHQAGVLPAYQDSGVGYALKLAQRKAALAAGLDLITWTFDPLQGRNAYFNLHKLGVVCDAYLPDLYGRMRDDLNQGLPSDRFKAAWRLTSERVIKRLAGPGPPSFAVTDYPLLNPGPAGQDDLAPPDNFIAPHGSDCLVQVPADITPFKAEAPDVALKWRFHTRKIFTEAFAAGYTAVDLSPGAGWNYYLLQKDWRSHENRTD